MTPNTLLRIIPHFRETAWSKQQNVVAAIEMARILPGVAWVLEASRTFWANDTEFGAVFSRMMKVIPKRQVAKKTGFLR